MPGARPLPSWCLFVAAAGAGGCASGAAGPRDALHGFAEATARGDAAGAAEGLSAAGRQRLGEGAVAPVLARDAALLTRRARAFAAASARVDERAEVTLAGGGTAELVREGGGWRIRRVAGWPGGAATPEGVIVDLRQALATRSHGALLRLLTRESARAVERELEGLVEGLEDAEGVLVEVSGDRAVVTVPGGRRLLLQREDGVWKVREIQ